MEGMVKRIIETALKIKERTTVFRELRETVEITLETIKHELLEEKQFEQILKEIAEITVKRPCDVLRHPTTTVKELLNTPNVKIIQQTITKTVACREIKLHDIIEVSTTFTIETIEIQTKTKKYIIVTNIIEVKPSY